MIQTIIFSKNRAAQLDLLLRSIGCRASDVFNPIYVLYTATEKDYLKGYEICEQEHPEAIFNNERDYFGHSAFQHQVETLLSHGKTDNVVFLCDDDIVLRPFLEDPTPEKILQENNSVICVSLRLGLNTTYCYPLRKEQKTPLVSLVIKDSWMWNWRNGDGDWGYPGSLDGHIFRRNMLRTLLAGCEYKNPNELEDQLSVTCGKLRDAWPLMACYETSVITGIPVNLVNDTHDKNRNGETYPKPVVELNRLYLKGQRLNLGSHRRKDVTGAHTELELSFA